MQLPATATLEQAAELQRLLDEAAAGSGEWVVDASALKQFDTSAIALLLEARRRAQAAARPFRIASPPPKLVELARLYGVDSLLPLPST